MLRLSNISIGLKLALMSGLSILLVLGILATQLAGNRSVRGAHEIADLQQTIVADTMTIEKLEARMQLGVRDIRLSRTTQMLEGAVAGVEEMAKSALPLVESSLKVLRVPANRERMQKVGGLIEQYAAGARKIAAMQAGIITNTASGTADGAGRAATLLEEREKFAREVTLPIAAELNRLVEEISKNARNLANTENEHAAEAMTRAEQVSMIVGLAAILVLIASVVFAARTIARPLKAMVKPLEEIAAGNFTVAIPGTGRKDEVGQIAEAVHGMAQKMSQTIAEIKASGREVTNASAEIATSTTDLSQRTEEQAASLEETSAAMEELAATVRKNAENAQLANQDAATTREVADRGGQVVAKAVDAMARIEESSRKISDIIGVIDEIARQTNLLALNAAVEAARAGEAGRGFAVVASEVRSLAQRSSQAAKDIKDLITNSNGQVKDGVDLVNRAGRSLNEIVESINKVAAVVADIANASAEQATGIDQINKALTQMDEVTQQNSALVEENAATAKTLEHQAKAMDEQVAVFQIGDAVAIDAAVMKPTAAKPAVAKAATARPATKPAIKPSANAREMQTVLATAVGQDWKEF
ncbi:MAG: HAMP domain-containing protein [Pseudolabrys sp.]|nr:HAMP domain-containing protein [Pseudolabrys sp.]